MFESDQKWMERLYQAKYTARALDMDNLSLKLNKLELKFHNLELDVEDYILFNDIEDEIEKFVTS